MKDYENGLIKAILMTLIKDSKSLSEIQKEETLQSIRSVSDVISSLMNVEESIIQSPLEIGYNSLLDEIYGIGQEIRH